MSDPEDGSCYAKGSTVWKSSRKTENEDGSHDFTLGFPVCEVSEYVSAEAIAKCLTAGERFGNQFIALAEHLGCKPEDLNVDLVQWYEALRWHASQDHGGTARSALGKLPEKSKAARQALPHDTVDRADKE